MFQSGIWLRTVWLDQRTLWNVQLLLLLLRGWCRERWSERIVVIGLWSVLLWRTFLGILISTILTLYFLPILNSAAGRSQIVGALCWKVLPSCVIRAVVRSWRKGCWSILRFIFFCEFEFKQLGPFDSSLWILHEHALQQPFEIGIDGFWDRSVSRV